MFKKWVLEGGIITARILTVRPHPQAERLVICDLDTGSGNCTVVTGATNVAVGQIVPWRCLVLIYTVVQASDHSCCSRCGLKWCTLRRR